MDKISRLTKSVLVDKGLNRAAGAALICHEAEKVFKNIFGEEFLREAKIISSREDCLYISTTSSVHSQEIALKEKEIVDAINCLLPNKQIKRIRFKPSIQSEQNHS